MIELRVPKKIGEKKLADPGSRGALQPIVVSCLRSLRGP